MQFLQVIVSNRENPLCNSLERRATHGIDINSLENDLCTHVIRERAKVPHVWLSTFCKFILARYRGKLENGGRGKSRVD